MRFYVVLRYLAFSLLMNAGFLLLSGGISLLHDDTSFFPLVYSGLIAIFFGLFPLIFIPPQHDIVPKEGLAIVVYSWLVSCLVGILPYVLWGGEFDLSNAWFESVSGYTTTGSSILVNIEALPPGLLFWRSATHFIGGVGIVILALAILPHMKISETILLRSESSPWALRDFRASAGASIRIVFRIYIGLIVLETFVLALLGMDIFDALTTSFGTIATGGFSVKQVSIAAYQSVWIEIAILIFMIFSGLHFGLLYVVVRGDVKALFRSAVARYYGATLLVATLIATLSVHGKHYERFADALRYASFQVVSVGTSTGFASADSSVWPPLAHLILVFLTLQCACAGSTSGGIKIDRMLVLLKAVIVRIKEIRHPRGIFTIRMQDKVLEENVIIASLAYIPLYLLVVFFSSLLLAAMGMDSLSAFTGSAAAMGNVGPGLGSVGSTNSYAYVPTAGKWILSVVMLLGRLEVYGLVICLVPAIWRKGR